MHTYIHILPRASFITYVKSDVARLSKWSRQMFFNVSGLTINGIKNDVTNHLKEINREIINTVNQYSGRLVAAKSHFNVAYSLPRLSSRYVYDASL